MAEWDLLLEDVRLATMVDGALPYGIIEDGAIAIAGGNIAWVGAAAELPDLDAAVTRSLAGRWVTPALIDCH
ncbi:MAG TPA: imidazolonepropionase, partial [Sphingomonadaceae bacterium]|nr:imidazolonepropionase [Sphingomonadaceae bacterium]